VRLDNHLACIGVTDSESQRATEARLQIFFPGRTGPNCILYKKKLINAKGDFNKKNKRGFGVL
jgi:hypothetical protein